MNSSRLLTPALPLAGITAFLTITGCVSVARAEDANLKFADVFLPPQSVDERTPLIQVTARPSRDKTPAAPATADTSAASPAASQIPDGPAAFIYGTFTGAGSEAEAGGRNKTNLQLSVSFTPESSWELVVPGFEGKNQITLTDGVSENDITGTWYWRGELRLEWNGEGPATPPKEKIVFTLVNAGTTKTAALHPAEIWMLAGGEALKRPPPDPLPVRPATTPAPPSTNQDPPTATPNPSAPARDRSSVPEGVEIWTRSLGHWSKAKSTTTFPLAFAGERRRHNKNLLPVLLILDADADAEIKNWAEKLRALSYPWPDGTDHCPFGCQGLVWWQGERDAEAYLSGIGLKSTDFRKDYGEALYKCLNAWRQEHARHPGYKNTDKPTDRTEDDDEKSGRESWNAWLQKWEPHLPGQNEAVRIAIVQLPQVNTMPERVSQFHEMWKEMPREAGRGNHSYPVSLWSEIRYAQADAWNALRVDKSDKGAATLFLHPGSPRDGERVAGWISPQGISNVARDISAAMEKLPEILVPGVDSGFLVLQGYPTTTTSAADSGLAPLLESLAGEKPLGALPVKSERDKLFFTLPDGSTGARTAYGDARSGRYLPGRGKGGADLILPAFSVPFLKP